MGSDRGGRGRSGSSKIHSASFMPHEEHTLVLLSDRDSAMRWPPSTLDLQRGQITSLSSDMGTILPPVRLDLQVNTPAASSVIGCGQDLERNPLPTMVAYPP